MMDKQNIWESYEETQIVPGSKWAAVEDGRLRVTRFKRGDNAYVEGIHPEYGVSVKIKLRPEDQTNLPKIGMKISGIEFQTGDPVILTRDSRDLSGMGSKERFYMGDRGFVGFSTQAAMHHVNNNTPGIDVKNIENKPAGQFVRLVPVHFPDGQFIQIPPSALAEVSPTDDIIKARQKFLNEITERYTWRHFAINKDSFLRFFKRI